MIYYSADDYGLNEMASMRIQQCIDQGKLNKVSVFPNFNPIDIERIKNNNNIRLSLHINLVEGTCMAKGGKGNILADEEGNFRHTFGGLFKASLLQRKRFEEQVYEEIKAQVLFWKSILPADVPFCIDSHQHTHMIPGVFKNMVRVLQDENIDLDYMRIPTEPLGPYIKEPSLYFSYSAINIVKQWLLNFLWLINKKWVRDYKMPTSYFMGILFSGKMDEKRVRKILPRYIELAKKKGRDIEVLFHPGYLSEEEIDLENKNIVFKEFYLSENRKTEYDSVTKITERREE